MDDPLYSLVRAAIERDPRSLRRLVDAVAPDVLRVVAVILGPRGEAEIDDLTQEALLGFVRSLPSFRGDSSVRRFARRVAARTTATHLRRSARKAGHHERWVKRELATPTTTGVELDVARQRELLRELLARLPSEQSETLVLRVVLGCSINEIAEATDAPANTVRSRLRLAKVALRRQVEEEPGLAERLEISS